MPIKICNKCNENKELDHFDIQKWTTKDGVLKTSQRKTCKQCRIKYRAEVIAKDPLFYKNQYANMDEEKRKKYIKKKSANNRKIPDIKEKRKTYNASDKGIFARYVNDCNRRGRKSRGIKMLLSFEEFSYLINSSCSYCGKDNCRGVDRIDSGISYTVQNTVPCCPDCNEMKNDKTVEEFHKHIEKIYLKIKESKI